MSPAGEAAPLRISRWIFPPSSVRFLQGPTQDCALTMQPACGNINLTNTTAGALTEYNQPPLGRFNCFQILKMSEEGCKWENPAPLLRLHPTLGQRPLRQLRLQEEGALRLWRSLTQAYRESITTPLGLGSLGQWKAECWKGRGGCPDNWGGVGTREHMTSPFAGSPSGR